jgi:membrane fusion protein (multidrug efflux system)
MLPPTTPPRGRGALLLPVLPVLGLVSACLLACGKGPEPEDDGPPPPVVETMVTRPQSFDRIARFPGQLETADSVVIKPEISGVVDEVLFEDGETVEKDQPLVRLRDDEQRALVAVAEAEYRVAKDAYERSQRLRKQDARSEIEHVRARSAYEVARARLELARVQLARTVIRAPFDGVMGEGLVSSGERVSPGGSDRFGGNEATGIGRLEALDRMELVFTVPETIAVDSALGLPVKLRVASHPERVFEGQVSFVGPRVNAQNRRVLVKAQIPNPERLLKPGMFTDVEMRLGRVEDALLLPEDAVRFEASGAAVWRVTQDGLAEDVPVELGQREGARVQITKGLSAGDEVIVAGTHKVSAGERVEAIRVDAHPPSGAELGATPEPGEAGT